MNTTKSPKTGLSDAPQRPTGKKARSIAEQFGPADAATLHAAAYVMETETDLYYSAVSAHRLRMLADKLLNDSEFRGRFDFATPFEEVAFALGVLAYHGYKGELQQRDGSGIAFVLRQDDEPGVSMVTAADVMLVLNAAGDAPEPTHQERPETD